jgi:glycosyltransferase involved in cell wall biosynthesis
MRILMFVPKYPPTPAGGLERQAHLLARELIAQGHSVHVLAVDLDRDQPCPSFEGVSVSRLPGELMVREAGALARWLARFGGHFDVCHIHGLSNVSVLVANLCRGRGLPAMLKLPNHEAVGVSVQRRMGELWRRGFVRADAAVAMTGDSVKSLESIGFPRARVFCTTNGVCLPELPRAHQSASGGPTFLFAGRIQHDKGIFDLVRAWDLARSSLPDSCKLRILGDGPCVSELADAIAERRLTKSVELAGWVLNAGSEYLKADVCVLPSYLEGNSNTVLEAMAAGLPIISTAVGGTPMLVGTEGAPFLCTPRDVRALAQMLVEFGRDGDKRAQVGAQMRERARRHFAIPTIAQGYLRAYSALASGRRDDVRYCSPLSFEVA